MQSIADQSVTLQETVPIKLNICIIMKKNKFKYIFTYGRIVKFLYNPTSMHRFVQMFVEKSIGTCGLLIYDQLVFEIIRAK